MRTATMQGARAKGISGAALVLCLSLAVVAVPARPAQADVCVQGPEPCLKPFTPQYFPADNGAFFDPGPTAPPDLDWGRLDVDDEIPEDGGEQGAAGMGHLGVYGGRKFVAENGAGFDPSAAVKMFDPFKSGGNQSFAVTNPEDGYTLLVDDPTSGYRVFATPDFVYNDHQSPDGGTDGEGNPTYEPNPCPIVGAGAPGGILEDGSDSTYANCPFGDEATYGVNYPTSAPYTIPPSIVVVLRLKRSTAGTVSFCSDNVGNATTNAESVPGEAFLPVGYSVGGCKPITVGTSFATVEIPLIKPTNVAPWADFAWLVTGTHFQVSEANLQMRYEETGGPVEVPATKAKLTQDCVDDNGTVWSHTSEQALSSSNTYTVPACPDVQPGTHVKKLQIVAQDDNGQGDKPILTYEPVTAADAAKPNAPAECIDGAGTAACQLRVEKQTAPQVWTDCGQLGAGCATWQQTAQPQVEAGTAPQNQTYRCVWGEVMSPTDCNQLENAYNPNVVDQDDPVQQEWQEQQSQPTPQPSPVTSPGSVTNNSTNSQPLDDTLPGTNTDVTTGSGCFPHGWGVLNPVEWVMRPVACVLKWAFVPPAGYWDSQLEQVQDVWDGTAPGEALELAVGAITAVRDGIAEAANGSTDCRGLMIPVGGNQFPMEFHPLDACDGVGEWLAPKIKLLITVLTVLQGAVAFFNVMSSAIGGPEVGEPEQLSFF